MAATLSNLSIGARSVSCAAKVAGADSVTFAEIAAAYLTAGGKASDAIYSFLTTSHTDAENTAKAVSGQGAILDTGARSANVAVYISGDNTIAISGAATVAIRIALKASIAA